jgi:hypothetical protein
MYGGLIRSSEREYVICMYTEEDITDMYGDIE